MHFKRSNSHSNSDTSVEHISKLQEKEYDALLHVLVDCGDRNPKLVLFTAYFGGFSTQYYLKGTEDICNDAQ